MTHITPSAWSVTKDDLPDIKKLLSIILGEHLGASLRLEVFARLAGFRTYASLKSRLENFADINGDPFPARLVDDPVLDKEFFAQLPVEARRHLADIEETGLVRMVIAGLHKSRHPVLGNLGIDAALTIDDLRTSCERLFHPASVSREKGTPKEMTNSAALVVTPENVANIRESSGLPQGDFEDTFAIFPFDFPETDAFPRLPTKGEIRTVSDPAQLARMLAGRKVYAYSTDDLFAIKKKISHQGAKPPAHFIQLKSLATESQDLPLDTDLFTLGSVMECDIPECSSQARPEIIMFWMLEILTFVHAYQKEREVLVSAQ